MGKEMKQKTKTYKSESQDNLGDTEGSKMSHIKWQIFVFRDMILSFTVFCFRLLFNPRGKIFFFFHPQ